MGEPETRIVPLKTPKYLGSSEKDIHCLTERGREGGEKEGEMEEGNIFHLGWGCSISAGLACRKPWL